VVVGRSFVKRFALCYQTVVCLSYPVCLSMTLVYCGQTVRWIKMELGTEVGLGPSHIVLDEDPAPPPEKGHNPQFSATWYGGRPRPRRHCVRWETRSPEKVGGTAPPILAHVLWPKGWMDQDVTWYGSWPRPMPHCVTWEPSSPKRDTTSPNFRPMSVVAKRLNGSRCHLVGR